ncbi:unnamed protein product (macronuclear) [Paramecium tetraurelia]|uniref:Uncharacterized protein n=1 Tax=Paramecium tetraurelia TaxID=5888 RepID=A0EH77_PARTE|nr:uncharacterized protein GSPATT00026992001 [Paramecium tetraurelia]CAK94668.1 unnamed protein product [Paramecium tetraurelia]|eukprot:XP_001462041.1 hypothetical protein (macronuclear) [Paramecium tetraurelia strain d4-2]
MAYQLDLSQSKFIVDDTPQLKREPPAIFAKKESTDYFDVNSTICECNEEIEPYAFQLRFKVELKQDPIVQTQEEKELCNMGSSFGVNDGDKNNNFDNPIDHVNQNTQGPKDNNQILGESKQSFNHIQKRNVLVQTNKLMLKNQQQLFKYNQKYVNHAVYQETLLSLKQKQIKRITKIDY